MQSINEFVLYIFVVIGIIKSDKVTPYLINYVYGGLYVFEK